MLKSTFLFLLFTALLFSCSDIRVKPEEKIYFSISSYIDTLAARLNEKDVQLLKEANLNQQTDSTLIKDVNWEQELNIFKEAEINKSAYRGKFIVDSTQISDKELRVQYQTEDKKIRTKFLELNYLSGEIESISVKLSTKNTLYNSTQRLELNPNSGFSVYGTQNIAQLNEDTFKLKGTFIFDSK